MTLFEVNSDLLNIEWSITSQITVLKTEQIWDYPRSCFFLVHYGSENGTNWGLFKINFQYILAYWKLSLKISIAPQCTEYWFSKFPGFSPILVQCKPNFVPIKTSPGASVDEVNLVLVATKLSFNYCPRNDHDDHFLCLFLKL